MKIASDNSINKINKRILTIVNKLGTDSELYKAFTDYFTIHGINTRQKNGIIQLVRGKKANVTINRKMLAEIAVSDPKAFAEIAEIAKKA